MLGVAYAHPMGDRCMFGQEPFAKPGVWQKRLQCFGNRPRQDPLCELLMAAALSTVASICLADQS
jgi:hypothetical protein